MKNLMDKYPRVLDLLQKAKKRLPHFASEYLFSGTGYDLAIKNNTEILKNIFLCGRFQQRSRVGRDRVHHPRPGEHHASRVQTHRIQGLSP